MFVVKSLIVNLYSCITVIYVKNINIPMIQASKIYKFIYTRDL